MQWTALDLKNLAALFDDVADALWSFRIQNASALTQADKDLITTRYGQLVSYGEQLENKAVQSALSDIDGDVAALQNATHDATHALQVTSDVQKAIGIAVAAVGLGAAILNPTPGTIAGSLSTLVQSVKSAAAKPDPDAAGSGAPAGN
jgi:hypothetical protein